MDPGRHHSRFEHGVHRRHCGGRRASCDANRFACDHCPGSVGDRILRTAAGGATAHRRIARRSLRAAQGVRVGRGLVLRRVGMVRAFSLRVATGDRARRARRGRGAAGAGQPGADQCQFSGERAGTRNWHVVRFHIHHGSDWARIGWMAGAALASWRWAFFIDLPLGAAVLVDFMACARKPHWRWFRSTRLGGRAAGDGEPRRHRVRLH